MADDTAQQQVTEALKQHGASLFVPLVGANDVDLAVRGQDGQYVEVRILRPDDGPRRFPMGRFRPKAHVFLVCVEAAEIAWIIPSGVFERFADGAQGADRRVLDLDKDDMGESLGDRLNVYKDRWVLIAEYSKYRSTLSDPVSLQMIINMG